MENKLNSTRKVTIKNIDKNIYGRIGLVYLKDEKTYKRNLFKIPLLDDNFKTLEDWNSNILQHTGDEEYYELAKRGNVYVDYCFVKLKMEYDQEKKISTNIIKTKIVVNGKEKKDVELEELQKLLSEASKCDITIKASSLYKHNEKKGIKYLIEKVSL